MTEIALGVVLFTAIVLALVGLILLARQRLVAQGSVPIVVNDRRVGYLLITRHLDDFSLLSRQALLDRLLGTLAVFGVGMLLSLAFAWSLSRPLLELGDAARRVAAGDLAIRLELPGDDEFSRLADSHNRLAADLGRRNQELR